MLNECRACFRPILLLVNWHADNSAHAQPYYAPGYYNPPPTRSRLGIIRRLDMPSPTITLPRL
jgi:hypothetical protein